MNFKGRRSATIENDLLRVTVLQEGGHIAEISDKQTGVNPLWIPPWPSIEPSAYDLHKHPQYGTDLDAMLLAGIMGHNVCLDIFGGPSADEAAAGMGVHGEAPVLPYEISGTSGTALRMRAELPVAAITFDRTIELHGPNVRFVEIVESLSPVDRPIGWTQHVTLGPPFLERGVTQFRSSATRSRVFDTDFGAAPYLRAGAEFIWPIAPRKENGTCDMSVYTDAAVSGAFTTHLMAGDKEQAFFTAYSPSLKAFIGYVWKPADFPWMGIWEENRSRSHAPWNGNAIARGMEFGVSPFPESRREMVDRGRLFDVPTYRWLPAKGRLQAEYWATVRGANSIPESFAWPV